MTWAAYNIRNADKLQHLLAEYMRQRPKEGQMGTSMDTLMKVQVKTQVKRRAAPKMSAPTVGLMGPGEYRLLVGPPGQADGYVWRRFEDDAGVHWYSATGPTGRPEQWITMTPIPASPPESGTGPGSETGPKPGTDDGQPFTGWVELLAAWKRIVDREADVLASLVETIDALAEALDDLVSLMLDFKATLAETQKAIEEEMKRAKGKSDDGR